MPRTTHTGIRGLPEAGEYDELLRQLNAIPSKVLGVRGVDE